MKYIPYESPSRQAARGVSNSVGSVSRSGGISRCEAACLEKKARDALLICQDVGRLVDESSLGICLVDMWIEYTKRRMWQHSHRSNIPSRDCYVVFNLGVGVGEINLARTA